MEINKVTKSKLAILAAIFVYLNIGSSNRLQIVEAQGTKGGSFSFNQQQQQFSQPTVLPTSSNNQISSSFVQMFNQLTPIQQQQFVRQMSSSNRKIFQQSFQPLVNQAFSEEVSSSSGGSSSVPQLVGGTKSSSFKSSSQNSVLSPIQQGFFRSQQSKQISSSQPQIISQPGSSSFFSQRIQQSSQPTVIPQLSSQSNFQTSKTVVNQVQPQQASFFNRVQEVQQVAQPVVLPSSEQSFKRVQSFVSQPLPVDTSSNSYFNQQFVQQQVQPVQAGFSKFQQSQFSSSASPQPVQTGFNQFTSSSSSNLAGSPGFSSSSQQFGNNQFGSTSQVDANGFSSALQQEKLDAGSIDSTSQLQQTLGGVQNGFNSFSQSSNNVLVPGNSQTSFEQSSSGFDSSDAQQKNAPIPDDFYGVTAASINNKWYIMKPLENPIAFGLGEAGAKLRQIPMSRTLNSQAAQQELSTLQAASKAAQGSSSSSLLQVGKKKKTARSTSAAVAEDNKKREANEPKVASTSGSSLDSSDDDEEETRRR